MSSPDGVISALHAGLAPATAGGHVPAAWPDTVLIAVAIGALTVACVFIVRYLRRSARRPKQVADQWQALAVMGELCPHGWQAEITLYGWGAPVPEDAPPSRVPQVELTWMEFEADSARVAVARRLWAPTIEQALQTMVDARRTDLTLEQIEQAAPDDGLEWQD
jgi:hypothetical protein